MIYFIGGFIFYFIMDKIKNKLMCRFLHTGIKAIKWKSDWHKEQNFIYILADWILI
jgi:hypothetical protein